MISDLKAADKLKSAFIIQPITGFFSLQASQNMFLCDYYTDIYYLNTCRYHLISIPIK